MSQFYSLFFWNINPSQKGESWVNKCQMSVFYSLFFGDVQLDVSKNRDTPKSSISIGFSIINHPFWGYHYYWRCPISSGDKLITDLGKLSISFRTSRDPGRFFGRAEGRRPALRGVGDEFVLFTKRKFMGLFSKQRFEDGILFGRSFGKKNLWWLRWWWSQYFWGGEIFVKTFHQTLGAVARSQLKPPSPLVGPAPLARLGHVWHDRTRRRFELILPRRVPDRREFGGSREDDPNTVAVEVPHAPTLLRGIRKGLEESSHAGDHDLQGIRELGLEDDIPASSQGIGKTSQVITAGSIPEHQRWLRWYVSDLFQSPLRKG